MLDVVARGALDFARMNAKWCTVLAAVGAVVAAGVFVTWAGASPNVYATG